MIPEQTEHFLRSIMAASLGEREAAVDGLLRTKMNADALNGHQKVVDDIRRLIKSGELGAIAFEGFATDYPWEEMEAYKRMFLDAKKAYWFL